jgi:uncharacterized protein involved in exopolysaccharide biosynthesis
MVIEDRVKSLEMRLVFWRNAAIALVCLTTALAISFVVTIPFEAVPRVFWVLVGIVAFVGVLAVLGPLGGLWLIAHTLRQWWKVATPIGVVLGALIGGAIWWWYVPVYRAEALLKIESRRPYIAYPQRGSSRTYVQNQVNLIRSPLVLRDVLQEKVDDPKNPGTKTTVGKLPEVLKHRDPIEWLQSGLQVRSLGGSELFTVSFTSPNPKTSAGIVNAIVRCYFQVNAQEDAERTQNVINLLEEEMDRWATEVARQREYVRELAKQATGQDPFEPRTAAPVSTAEHPAATLHRRLTESEAERIVLEVQIQALRKAIANHDYEVPDSAVEAALAERPGVRAFEEALAAKRAKLNELRLKLSDGDQDPRQRSLRDEIASDEQRLAKVRQELFPEVRAELKAAAERRDQQALDRMKNQAESYELMERFFEERYREERAKVKEFTGDTLKLMFAQADLDREEAVHRR